MEPSLWSLHPDGRCQVPITPLNTINSHVDWEWRELQFNTFDDKMGEGYHRREGEKLSVLCLRELKIQNINLNSWKGDKYVNRIQDTWTRISKWILISHWILTRWVFQILVSRLAKKPWWWQWNICWLAYCNLFVLSSLWLMLKRCWWLWLKCEVVTEKEKSNRGQNYSK